MNTVKFQLMMELHPRITALQNAIGYWKNCDLEVEMAFGDHLDLMSLERFRAESVAYLKKSLEKLEAEFDEI